MTYSSATLSSSSLNLGKCSYNTNVALLSNSRSWYVGNAFNFNKKVNFSLNFCKVKQGRTMAVRASLKSEEYNKIMQQEMRNPHEYHHDLGMNYTKITPNLIVGSQPQKPEDVGYLRNEEGVNVILNLQEDKDVEYWSVDLDSIIRRCQQVGIQHVRCPARDFDGDSLRKQLPKAVSKVDEAISNGKIVYLHCTAGLGRAPAVAIAYLFWFSDMNLGMAYEMVTKRRPCGPRKNAIRGATYDLAKNDPNKEPFDSLSERAFTGVADWERKLIRERVRALRSTN